MRLNSAGDSGCLDYGTQQRRSSALPRLASCQKPGLEDCSFPVTLSLARAGYPSEDAVTPNLAKQVKEKRLVRGGNNLAHLRTPGGTIVTLTMVWKVE